MDVGRRKRIKRDWRVVFEEFGDSGSTVKEFCRVKGISQSLFYRYRKDYGDAGLSSQTSFGRGDFIELQPGSSSRWSAAIVFDGRIELSVSNDCDKELLGLLISQLKGSSC